MVVPHAACPHNPNAIVVRGHGGSSSSADGDINPVMASLMGYLQQQNDNQQTAMAQQHHQHAETQQLMIAQGQQHQELHAEQLRLTRDIMRDSQSMMAKQISCMQTLAGNSQSQSRRSGSFAHTHIYI